MPHLALRSKVFIFPGGLEKSEYVLVDGTIFPDRNTPELALERQENLVTVIRPGREGRETYRYEVVTEAQGYLLLRRQAARNAVRAKAG